MVLGATVVVHSFKNLLLFSNRSHLKLFKFWLALAKNSPIASKSLSSQASKAQLMSIKAL